MVCIAFFARHKERKNALKSHSPLCLREESKDGGGGNWLKGDATKEKSFASKSSFSLLSLSFTCSLERRERRTR